MTSKKKGETKLLSLEENKTLVLIDSLHTSSGVGGGCVVGKGVSCGVRRARRLHGYLGLDSPVKGFNQRGCS